METSEGTGVPEGVTTASSPEAKTEDPLKNLKAEMNRKLSKMTERVDQLVKVIAKTQQMPVDKTDNEIPVDAEVKTYVDARLVAVQEEQATAAHQRHWKEAVATFPELNQDSESFDEEFYNDVDRYYTKFKKSDPTDPNALRDALELVATRSGKTQQLLRTKVLQDEARRSRIISEGGAAPRQQKKEKEAVLNETNLARLGINPDKLRQRIKANKAKYEVEE